MEVVSINAEHGGWRGIEQCGGVEQRGGVVQHGDLGTDGGSVRLGLQAMWSLRGVEQCEGVEQRE